jgi:hypothetical protein
LHSRLSWIPKSLCFRSVTEPLASQQDRPEGGQPGGRWRRREHGWHRLDGRRGSRWFFAGLRKARARRAPPSDYLRLRQAARTGGDERRRRREPQQHGVALQPDPPQRARVSQSFLPRTRLSPLRSDCCEMTQARGCGYGFAYQTVSTLECSS